MTIGYYKLSGAGNDFLGLVEPERIPAAEEIRTWCRRGVSLGADGVFVLSRSDGGAVDMAHFNADGGRAELCLNGSRCAARLAFELGWDRNGTVELHTDAGVLAARPAGDDTVEIELPPIVGEPEPRVLEVGSKNHEGWTVRVGVPHWVLPWPGSLAGAPVRELGPTLRSHPDLAPDGANVDFVRFVTANRFEIRTFERGVEAETLACGTGVVAAVAAGLAAGCLELPVSALTAGGFELRVGGEAAAGRLHRPTFAGDARILAHGELRDGEASLPPLPSWS
ncbi:MAG: diaminopimelate epimerase [Thermoanaerobaculia bacterium]